MIKFNRIKNLGKYGKGLKGKEHPSWKGGKRLSKGYYLEIHSPNHPNRNNCNYVCKHRLVMEKHLKRYLRSDEIVHHKDGNILNNKINNLKLCSINEHSFLHYAERKIDKKGRLIAGVMPV